MTYDPKAPDWNILTRTRGGTVSLLKNLTEDEARACMQRLQRPFDRGNPWSEWAINEDVKRAIEAEEFQRKNPSVNGGRCYSSSSHTYSPSDRDLEQIECWGPPGVKLDVWPKPDDYLAKYKKALKLARAAMQSSGAA